MGSHLVKAHQVKIPPSKKNPNGIIITRQQHYAKNPSKKDTLSFVEIQLITNETFPQLKNDPSLGTLNNFKKNGDNYDLLIIRWVQYWNEVLAPTDVLDPKLVKALATESSFIPNSKTGCDEECLLTTIMKKKSYGIKSPIIKSMYVSVDIMAHQKEVSSMVAK